MLALATSLGLANTTFRRNFPDVCAQLTASPPTPGSTNGADAYTGLKADNARLLRDCCATNANSPRSWRSLSPPSNA
ncbi:hypothetical protein ACFVZR_39050 [Streptomyces sp. NPDC058316]|uniref:hypothetical protein n=1 Tax=Streptomyces sp. NPDC058316 TaxID=3346442 RepID=UPI0036EE8DFD